MTKKLWIIGMILVLCITTACTQKKEKTTDALVFKEEYESLNGTTREKDGKTIRSIDIAKDNPMVYAEAKDIVKKINKKESFIVYFGFSDCPWCRSILPTLLEVADDYDVEEIYYVNVKEIRDTMKIDENGDVVTDIKGTDDYYKLLELLDSVLETYALVDDEGNKVDTGEKRIYAPNIVSVVKGKVRSLESGVSDKQTDGYMKLTSKIKKDSYQKLEVLVKDYMENKDICSIEVGC